MKTLEDLKNEAPGAYDLLVNVAEAHVAEIISFDTYLTVIAEVCMHYDMNMQSIQRELASFK